ncbi:MAG: PTS sugar transporter subunit IIA [Pseudomonadota bacterium]
MLLQDIIQPDRVLCNAHARSKKHCLEILSELLVRSNPEIPSDTIFEALIERERLGCTSLKKGLAFPHCRIDGIEDSFAALIKLSEPVDFDAADGEPVDIVFGMMVPTKLSDEDYADVKAMTGTLADEGLRGRLRSTNSSSALFEALIDGTDLFSNHEPRTAAGG